MPPLKRLFIFTLCFTVLYTSILFFISPQPLAPPLDTGAGEKTQSENSTLPEPTAKPLKEDLQNLSPAEPPSENSDDTFAATEGSLSKHFMRTEFACDCAGYCDGFPVEMNTEFIQKLQELRNQCGGPIIITSGVRCPQRNAEVGGVPYSFHLRGLAADLYCPNMTPGNLLAIAQDIGLNTIAYYHHGYIHVELLR